ncbi:Alpha/Beta hydrolase protein [Thelonectria olida]|uniref:Alpha/Beta hydrolase protein n=1 Tax=Thelonectria olida TaxID=1576542 RepID=A0A9P8VYM5_9HYPO|nr:Alpha/Beta hydrolase protein [Thelonectria olida]
MRPVGLLPLALLAAVTDNVLAETTNCTEGLYIVVARGTGEAEGTGAFGNISQSIASKIDGSIIEPLDYPATFSDPSYSDSEKDGVKEMQDVILDYHKACPKAKFAVLGYSQGGQVASDAFCGGAGNGFSTLSALSSDFVADSFAAIVLFGDPSRLVNVTYNRGTSKKDGIFARNNVTFCEEHYGDLMRSFCDTGDRYCDEGDDSTVHGSYFQKYGKTVVDFVVQQYEAMEKASASSPVATTAASATASSTSTSTSTQATATDNAAAGTVLPHLVLVGAVWAGLEVMKGIF